MKIAYVLEKFPLVSETFILAQLTGMIDRGHDITIFARAAENMDVRHPAVDEYRLLDRTVFLRNIPRRFYKRIWPAIKVMADAALAGRAGTALRTLNFVKFGRRALSLNLLLGAAPFFSRGNFDIVHCQFGHLGVDIPEFRHARVLHGAIVTSFRGTDAAKNATRNPERFESLFAAGDSFLAVSEYIQDKLIAAGCPPEKIQVLRSGIDASRFAFRGHKPLHSPVRVLSVGRLAPNKGVEYALQAIAELAAAGVPVAYRILGNGPSIGALTDLAQSLGLKEYVEFCGSVNSDRVVEMLNDADILVLPSITGPHGEQEGLPNSLKEAMSIGVPVIATNIGGIPELVEDGRTGRLVAEKDPRAITKALQAMIANWESVADITAAARAKVELEFDSRLLNDRLEQVYKAAAVAQR